MPAAALTVLVAVIVIPPLVSINRYKSRITRLMSASLGRPVRLSSVELRLLPRPGFVLTDLTVEDDPSIGAEPVLHASTVKASIRLLPLWRGHLEISRVSVDEASLNLVRTTGGRWNLDALFRTAAAQPHPDGTNPGRGRNLPYLEATNSRINIKEGAEKLPYSLVGADLSFWQENPGDWRLRLRGQPVRTDVSLDLADTGIVELEASLRSAPEIRRMPVHVDLEWRESQLGQLSKLILGSDPGWRGDLTGEMHLDGTADSAQVTTRLRAVGVHRVEFAPAAPLDFDANCSFTYHYSGHGVQNLICDSPLGDGHLKVEANLPGNEQARFSLELQKIPAQAFLDALRTIRNQFGAGVEAEGTVSGKLTYDPSVPVPSVKQSPPPRKTGRVSAVKERLAKDHPTVPSPFTGNITVEALRLAGGSLNQPIQIQKIVLEPSAAVRDQGEALIAIVEVPAGGATPLVFNARLALSGYQLTIRGQGALSRISQLAHAAGLPDASALGAIAGEPVTLDLSIAGPWLPAPELSLNDNVSPRVAPEAAAAPTAPSDRLVGTVTLHNNNWKTDSLATAVQISQATLHLGGSSVLWDPVQFSYGPLKGTATLQIPANCEAPAQCMPTLNLQFDTLDVSELQSTLLGEHKEGTLLSSVIARLTPSSAPQWPAFEGTLKADSLILGPVTLENATAALRMTSSDATIKDLDADLLGGQVHVTGTVTGGEKPAYSFAAQFQHVSPATLCELIELKCTGSGIDGSGKIDLAGLTDKDLTSSAKGKLHFDWQEGSIAGSTVASAAPLPSALARFNHWTADAEISEGAVTLKENQVHTGSRKSAVEAAVAFHDPLKVTFAPPRSAAITKR
jgi:hypothetical protein